MNLNINKETLSIENKEYNLNEIDFILHKGKTRIYKSDGSSETILTRYTPEDRELCFLDIAYAVSMINKNYLFLKNGKLINLKNIKKIIETNNEMVFLTKGFNFQFNDVNSEQIELISKLNPSINIETNAVLL